MKLFYLDNEHSNYVIMAKDKEDAWKKMHRRGVLPPEVPEEDEILGCYPAYNDLVELKGDVAYLGTSGELIGI